MRDDKGIVQLWTVSPNGGDPVQLTRNAWDVASAFSWSPDGCQIAYAMDNSIFVTDVRTGQSTRLTRRSQDAAAPRPEACVFSPDGKKIAYVRRMPSGSIVHNQIFVLFLEGL
jgi:Tol biopolymer transport system component